MEAEMSIHQDALERSRVSEATFAQEMSPEGDSYAADDFGGDDDDGADDDFGFSDFVAADENGARYSSISFQDEVFVDDGPPGALSTKSATNALLDAICSGNNLGGNDYEFFDAATVEKLTTGNFWAGSAHWKKTERLRRKRTPPAGPKQHKKKESKKRVLVDLSKPPCLDDVLRAPPKSKRGADLLQLSKATKAKHGKADNLLPPDAGIGIEQLSTLFLRPNTVLGKADDKKAKTVGTFVFFVYVRISCTDHLRKSIRLLQVSTTMWNRSGLDLTMAATMIPLVVGMTALALSLRIVATTTS
jgi:condensin complex subunit 2